MKKRPFKWDLLILFSCFVVSRVVAKLLGVSFNFNALFEYWQYLDTTSLSRNLLQSLWYQHSQPPVFNLLLGIVLKSSGSHASIVFESLLLAITFFNAVLLLTILRNILYHDYLPLIFSLVYLLSPATILFENELFYTGFLSLLLLISVHFMVKFTDERSWKNALGIFLFLSLACLTKSMYHLLWLLVIAIVFVYLGFWRKGNNKIFLAALLSICLVAGWYGKNYLLFKTFSPSSWTGMNLSRNVFQNNPVTDSSNIASVKPFMPITYYKNFISFNYEEKYAGVSDRVLLMETKNERFINLNNAGYLEVSRKYMDACLKQIQEHPVSYLKNVFTAAIIYFTPASSYYKVADNYHLISNYDMIYSLNPSHLYEDDQDKKLWLAIAAIPKFLLYGFVFFILSRNGLWAKYFPPCNVFICLTIIFSIVVSSLFEYGENMRFRYEIEPLFLVLAAQAVASLLKSRND